MANVQYVFKFGDYIIPGEYIAEDGYDCTPNQRQDLEPYTDGNGITHRNAVEHTKSDVTLTFRELTWAQFTDLITGITSNYINPKERDAICNYLDMESVSISTGHMYLDPSCKFKLKRLNEKVNAFTLRFTEY